MSSGITIMGVLVAIIGMIGLFSWFNVYSQASGYLSTLSTYERTARGVQEVSSNIPIIGAFLTPISGMAGSTAEAIGSFRTGITMFLAYNILINVALIFIGASLVSLGTKTGKLTNKLRDTREYLRKQRDKNK